MPAQPPRYRWVPYPCTGVLDESLAPNRVGGSGLTDCLNVIYEREGAWGKRSGIAQAYSIPVAQGAFPGNPYVSGIRWYRAYPTPQTKTVFAAGGSLWQANDIGSIPQKLFDFTAAPSGPIRFTSARDPNAMSGSGSDVLIICGGTSDLGFAKDYILVTTNGPNGPGTVGINPGPSAKITLQFQRDAGSALTPGNTDPVQITYAILPTDNPTTIVANLVQLINQAYPVATNNAGPNPAAHNPFLCQAYQSSPNAGFGSLTGSVLHLGALFAGSAGNDITYTLTYTAGANGMGQGGSITFTDGAGTEATYSNANGSYKSATWTGGGGVQYGPLKWDGENPVDGLSYQITKGFKNCASWHDHVWYWNDEDDPDTVFASDIDQPEGFTFMDTLGGYDIGAGDGDPMVQDCVPIGNALYVFKTQSIYAIAGYDFQSGEYQFSVTPQVRGYGIPAPECVTVLENQLVFWSGKRFLRLAVGAYQPEFLGMTIPRTEGIVAAGNPAAMRVVAGDFPAVTDLNGNVEGGGTPSSVMRSSLALFAWDSNDVLCYDEEATQRKSRYAWAKWKGWDIGWWIPFGTGQNAAGTGFDGCQLLFLAPPLNGSCIAYLFGGHPTLDNGVAIPWMVQTGWTDVATPEVRKYEKRIFLELNATSGANIFADVIAAQGNIPNIQSGTVLPAIGFVPTAAPAGGEAYNVLQQQIQRAIQSPGYCMSITEDGTSAAAFELVSYGLDIIEESFT